MRSKLQIINETVKAYANPDNRGLDGDGECVYRSPDGKECALGRCMINPRKYWGAVPAIMNLTTRKDLTEKQFQRALREPYRGHSTVFWEELQKLHDTTKHFTKKGWSAVGKTAIKRLKNKWRKAV